MALLAINGLGLRLIGARKASEQGVFYGTIWLTAFFFPLIPIRRIKLRPQPGTRGSFSYQELERTPLVASEIALSYLWGLLVPIVAIAPLILSIPEIATAIGLPELVQVPLMVAGIVWLVVLTWKLKDWDERRWFAT